MGFSNGLAAASAVPTFQGGPLWDQSVSGTRGRTQTDQQLVADRQQASTLPPDAPDAELNAREFQTAGHRATAQNQQEESLQGPQHADEIDPDADGPRRRASWSRLEDDNA